MKDKIVKSEAEWKAQLTEAEHEVCRNKGTEAPFTGIYNDCKDEGVYRCKCCNEPLFSSDSKFDSGSGWPSFYRPIAEDAVTEHEDISHGMRRFEITCGRCDAHLGHVFPDGPNPTGLRYCMNSVSLSLAKT